MDMWQDYDLDPDYEFEDPTWLGTDFYDEEKYYMAQRPARGAATAAPATTGVAEGVLEQVTTRPYGNKTLYNYKVGDAWYGIGDTEPDGVYEGDTIKFDYKQGKHNPKGGFYLNAIKGSFVVLQEAPVAEAAPSTGAAITPAVHQDPDDRTRSIIMQASMKVAAQLLSGAVGGEKPVLKIPAKGAEDTLMGFFDRTADHIYLKILDTGNYPTLDGQVIDSIDDDFDDEDVGEFDD